MTGVLGFLFVATVAGILIRFVVSTVFGAITAAAADGAAPVAVVGAIGTFIGGIAALGSLILAIVKVFS